MFTLIGAVLSLHITEIKNYDEMCDFFNAVIDDETCEERLWQMKARGETNFYLCEINRDMVIDATYKGNKSRYINHSCCPNTEMQKWLSAHLYYCFIFIVVGIHVLNDLICFLGGLMVKQGSAYLQLVT